LIGQLAVQILEVVDLSGTREEAVIPTLHELSDLGTTPPGQDLTL
jgi:hypothetical protein